MAVAPNPALDTSTPDFRAQTGLEPKARRTCAEQLGRILADCYQLFIKTQGVHWNVAGPAFYSVHKLTEEQYEALYKAIDKVAERIRALGQKAPASYTTYGALSIIKDEDKPQTAAEMIAMLVRDNGLLCASLREGIEAAEACEDVVTADLLTGLLAYHEQASWMLQMHIAN
jgi:starvation-inducible DNA-binding protein